MKSLPCSQTRAFNGLGVNSPFKRRKTNLRHGNTIHSRARPPSQEWSISQAGALVATSLQQVLNKSVSEATPLLQDLWGSRGKAAENASSIAKNSWKYPLNGARSALEGGLSVIQKRNSDALEKQAADEAIQLLQSQAKLNQAFNLLKARAESNSQPGKRSDNFKLGLVVEGGGMRGASSAGSLQALHDLGLRNCFDAVYGSSAGACNATYFLSGQRHGAEIYAQHISNTDFIDLKRLYKRAKGENRELHGPSLETIKYFAA